MIVYDNIDSDSVSGDVLDPSKLFRDALEEIDNQPAFRASANRECDYADGNQLDSDVLDRQRQLGIPPAIEPLIGPMIDDVLGLEAKTRTDWRVIADSDKSGDEIADALNYRLNQAERRSMADRACSEAYESMVKVGWGWVEVAREDDPLKYPYRCKCIHRNEIWWDFLSRESDLSDARWLLRRKWTDLDIAKKMFPGKADLLTTVGRGWEGWDIAELELDGGSDTGLARDLINERGWSREEQEWRDREAGRICLFEFWHKVFDRVTFLIFSDGRAVEYDPSNEVHVIAAAGGIQLREAVVPRMMRSYFVGPHLLDSQPSPYRHNKFPYIPFFGKREDRTGVPYGLIRGMMFLQDEINARISKMQWLLSAKRIVRTEGAVVDKDPIFRAEVARPDADIKLNPEAMSADGIFKIEQDSQLNSQQAERLNEARESLRRVARITETFQGTDTGNKSGSAISQLIEQSVQGLADINDNFKNSRSEVGDMLLSLIIEDLKGKETTITIDGGLVSEDRVVTLNQQVIDVETELPYLNNNTEKVKLLVTLSDVPSTPSFRAQQLVSMSEAFKGMPEDYQKVTLPHLMTLMDVPLESKREIINAIREMSKLPSEDEIQERIDAAKAEALAEKFTEQKDRELDIKENESIAKIEKLVAEAVRKNIESIYAAVQAGREILTTPQVADSADQTLKSAGFEDQDAPPIVDQFGKAILPGTQEVRKNTSPMLPPVTEQPEHEMPVSEEPAAVESPVEGVGYGIEAEGTQG